MSNLFRLLLFLNFLQFCRSVEERSSHGLLSHPFIFTISNINALWLDKKFSSISRWKGIVSQSAFVVVCPKKTARFPPILSKKYFVSLIKIRDGFRIMESVPVHNCNILRFVFVQPFTIVVNHFRNDIRWNTIGKLIYDIRMLNVVQGKDVWNKWDKRYCNLAYPYHEHAAHFAETSRSRMIHTALMLPTKKHFRTPIYTVLKKL